MEKLFGAARDILEFLGGTGLAVAEAVRAPRKIRWRETLFYMNACGTQALTVVVMICFLMGLSIGFQAAVQMRQFGTELYVADLVGFSILKELGPLMVAMIATGRAGSSFAAEIGTMKVNEEIYALTTLGIRPERFLVLPKLFAMAVVMPVLTVFGDIAGALGGLAVGVWMLHLPVTAYLERTFEVLYPMAFVLSLCKGFVFGILIALVGCYRGLQAKSDAQGVGECATGAVVAGIFLVVLSDALMTMLFTMLGY